MPLHKDKYNNYSTEEKSPEKSPTSILKRSTPDALLPDVNFKGKLMVFNKNQAHQRAWGDPKSLRLGRSVRIATTPHKTNDLASKINLNSTRGTQATSNDKNKQLYSGIYIKQAVATVPESSTSALPRV